MRVCVCVCVCVCVRVHVSAETVRICRETAMPLTLSPHILNNNSICYV